MIGGVLRVMSYNIHSGRGGDDHVDLGRIAAVIASFDPDLVALQECGHGPKGAPLQAEELGKRLSMEPRYVPCLDRKNTRYGLATLSRLPIVETQVARLPHRGRVWWSEPRRALVTRVAWSGGQLASATIRSTLGGHLRLRTYQPVAVSGAVATPARGPNPNPLYRLVDAGQPLVANPAALPSPRLRPAHTLDISTAPGGRYEISPR